MKAARLAFAVSVALSAALAHYAVITALPGYITSRAMRSLEEAGLKWNAWAIAPRITPRSQTVVRSSPDLAHAVCLLDLEGGPILLRAPLWPDYGSLSVFDHTSANAYVTSLSAAGNPAQAIVATDDQPVDGNADIPVIRLPGSKGIALIRRLAPTDKLHDAARALAGQTECRPI